MLKNNAVNYANFIYFCVPRENVVSHFSGRIWHSFILTINHQANADACIRYQSKKNSEPSASKIYFGELHKKWRPTIQAKNFCERWLKFS